MLGGYMKHLLFFFTFIFLNLSCQKENSTTNELSARNFNFDNHVYHSISNSEGQSVLRQKILNNLLENKLKIKNEIPLKLTKDTSLLEDDIQKDVPNLTEYQQNRKNSAEIFVSYPDHLDVYFVPHGISRNKALLQLAIYPATGASFIWIDPEGTYLMKGKTYLLISTSIQELKENDIYFNHSEVSGGKNFNENSFNFSNGLVVHLKIIAEYFEREVLVNVFSEN